MKKEIAGLHEYFIQSPSIFKYRVASETIKLYRINANTLRNLLSEDQINKEQLELIASKKAKALLMRLIQLRNNYLKSLEEIFVSENTCLKNSKQVKNNNLLSFTNNSNSPLKAVEHKLSKDKSIHFEDVNLNYEIRKKAIIMANALNNNTFDKEISNKEIIGSVNKYNQLYCKRKKIKSLDISNISVQKNMNTSMNSNVKTINENDVQMHTNPNLTSSAINRFIFEDRQIKKIKRDIQNIEDISTFKIKDESNNSFII